MLNFTIGDLFSSPAYAIVNTVNCEGFMGKGLAYQFKLKYPQMNMDYVEQCKLGKLRPGTLHAYEEKGRLIVNFPTKDKWRLPSKMEYVEQGLDELVKLIQEHNIQSIAIPPLGCGNGGLDWLDVKNLIVSKLSAVAKDVDVYVYEPSQSVKKSTSTVPKLDIYAYLILLFKKHLATKQKVRLVTALSLFNIVQDKYNYSLDESGFKKNSCSFKNIASSITKYEKYYGLDKNDTDKVLELLYKQIVSAKVNKDLSIIEPIILNICNIIKEIKSTSGICCLEFLCNELANGKECTLEEMQYKALELNGADVKSKFNEKDLIEIIGILSTNNVFEECNLQNLFNKTYKFKSIALASKGNSRTRKLGQSSLHLSKEPVAASAVVRYQETTHQTVGAGVAEEQLPMK